MKRRPRHPLRRTSVCLAVVPIDHHDKPSSRTIVPQHLRLESPTPTLPQQAQSATLTPHSAESRRSNGTMATAADIPLLVVSENSSSERRVSPSWTIAQLKNRLEPVTGVPATCQKLSLKIGSQPAQPIESANEDATLLSAWPLQAYAEIKVGADFSSPCHRYLVVFVNCESLPGPSGVKERVVLDTISSMVFNLCYTSASVIV